MMWWHRTISSQRTKKIVALPNPELALIVHYGYVFHPRTAGDSGKSRPCVMMAVFADPADPLRTSVLYFPITHRRPGGDEVGLELGADTCSAAGLDDVRQWLLVSQGNIDTWPEDVGFVRRPGQFHYGFLPPRIFKSALRAFGELRALKRFNVVVRKQP
jgi:hypothetical protein